jgi:hypothetical protein
MKKLFFILIVLLLAVNFAIIADENEGIGLYFGLEAGVENVNKVNEEIREPYLMPMIIYDRSFFDDALDVYTELDYTFSYYKEREPNGRKEVYPQSLYFDLLFAYNMGLGGASTLSFILENEFDEIIIAPIDKKGNNITGIFTPAVKYTQEFDFGDIYAKAGLPIVYIQEYKEADTQVGLDFTLGWNSAFGLVLEAKALTLLVPGEGRGYLGLEALASYEMDTMYFEVFAEIPKEISWWGITLTPRFEYYLGNFTFYAYCEFAGIGVDGGGLRISPALGVKFSF